MPLKLAIVTAFPESSHIIRGGIESVSYSLAVGLRKLSDTEIHIIAPSSKLGLRREERDGMWINWVPVSRLPGFLDYWTVFRWRAHRILRDINPDITHFQGLAGWALGYSKPYILTIHGIAERDILHKNGPFLGLRRYVLSQVERCGRKQARHIVIINPYVEHEIGHQLDGTRWRIENPVAEEFFSLPTAETHPRILYVGRISALKNIEGLLRAFALVRATNDSAALRIAGEPEDRGYLQKCVRLVEELGIQHSVSFLGSLSRNALCSELAQARCLALVAKQENAPMVIAEAMAAGVPVVASRICGIPHMVREGETGLLVDPTNIHEIAKRISFMLDAPSAAAKMGQQSRTVALKQFHIRSVAERTLAVYKSILADTSTMEVHSES